MLALRLPIKIEKSLSNLAKQTGRTKSYYARLAIEEFLENYQDNLIVEERIRHAMPSIPLSEVIKKLGLEEHDLES